MYPNNFCYQESYPLYVVIIVDVDEYTFCVNEQQKV